MKGKKKDKKKKKPPESCQKCGESEVYLETMPCCGAQICWDWCLNDMPIECPVCKKPIRVEPKDTVTNESYVEIVDMPLVLKHFESCKGRCVLEYNNRNITINMDGIFVNGGKIYSWS